MSLLDGTALFKLDKRGKLVVRLDLGKMYMSNFALTADPRLSSWTAMILVREVGPCVVRALSPLNRAAREMQAAARAAELLAGMDEPEPPRFSASQGPRGTFTIPWADWNKGAQVK